MKDGMTPQERRHEAAMKDGMTPQERRHDAARKSAGRRNK
jgi:hypothetical protein